VKRRVRVLICNERFLPRFGHDRSLVLLGRHLASLGHEVAFACLRYEPRILSSIAQHINQVAIPDGADIRIADKLASELVLESWCDNRPDVVVTGGWPFFELAARSPVHGVPSLFIDAGAVPHDGYPEPMLSRQREVRRLRRRTLPFIVRVLPNSDFTRDSQTLPDRGHGAGVTTVRHGCDHMGMGFEPEGLDLNAEKALLAKLDSLSASGCPLILSLGRYEDQGYKNSPMVFDIFRAIRQRVPNVFLIVLAGPAIVAVPDDLTDSTICLSTFSDANLQEVMRRCALGLTMSLWEGLNAPLAEMQWLARPVLAFNVAAHPEVVVDPWFLCTGATDMARKAVRLLSRGVPDVITARERFERFHEKFGWFDTFARWAAEIEELAASPIPCGEPARRIVLMDITYTSRDPANSGIPNLTRRLAARLSENPGLFVIFVIWDRASGTYRLPATSDRSYLEAYAGPTDWLGKLIEQFGNDNQLERVLDAADPQCVRGPVLFFSEVALDGAARERASWGRRRGLKLAFIMHDMLPIYESQYVASAIVEAFPNYIEVVLEADAVWPNSPFTLGEFERYCTECGLIPPANREAVWLPGQLNNCERVSPAPANADELRILCVSTIEPRKNHRGLIEAFQDLRRRRPQLPLRLELIGNSYAGAEALLEWVLEAVRQDGRIEWRGPVSEAELEAEFARAAFTVYASRVEGFGFPILESLWMGKPCICNETGVMAELAAEGGCMVVDMSDPVELSIAMERVASDPVLMGALRRQIAAREIKTWVNYGDDIAKRLAQL